MPFPRSGLSHRKTALRSRADARGELSTRAFFGKYRVVVQHNARGHEFTLSRRIEGPRFHRLVLSE